MPIALLLSKDYFLQYFLSTGEIMKKSLILLLLTVCFNSLAQTSTITRFSLGSCFAPQLTGDIWPIIGDYKPQLHIALGDNVYQEREDHDMQQPNLAAAYQLLRNTKSFTDFAKQVEILPVWDDHDYGFNDAGGSFKPKKRSQQLFNQMWEVATNDPRRHREGFLVIVTPFSLLLR